MLNIPWRLQVTEFTKFIDFEAARSYKHEFLTYPHGGYAQLVITISLIINLILISLFDMITLNYQHFENNQKDQVYCIEV